MQYELTVPSKTFLLGEYAVLKGCEGIILTTKPRFKLSAAKNAHLLIDGIHSASPAGKLISKYMDFFGPYHIQFHDPHHQLGGFGASSAQFLMVYALMCYMQEKPVDHANLLTEYLVCSDLNQALPPSGADVIAQLYGEITVYKREQKKVQTYAWPFAGLEYALIHTGNKINTHEHLQMLQDFDMATMQAIVEKSLQALANGSSTLFVEAIQLYAQEMKKQGFVAKQTAALLDKMAANPAILAAKGCGGLAADVVLVLYKKMNQAAVVTWLRNEGYHVITHGQEAAQGLSVNCVAEKAGGL